MALRCLACGRLSRDEVACDGCRAPLSTLPHEPPPLVCPAPCGTLSLTLEQVRWLSRADQSLLLVDGGDESWRVHWLGPAAWNHWRGRVEDRSRRALASLPPMRIQHEPEGVWAFLPAGTPLALPLANETNAEPRLELERLLAFLDRLAVPIAELHARGLVWLNCDPLEIEVDAATDRLRLTNLDLQVFPKGRIDPQTRLRPHFVAPEILRNQPAYVGPATDVFHLGLIAYYWLAGLLPDGFPGEGLDAFAYHLPRLRVYAPRLAPGVAGILEKALEVVPSRRFANPHELVGALRQAARRNATRERHAGAVHWDIGAHTRAGRTKTALGKENEDKVLVRQFAGPQRAMVAVADGISTCDVGSGQLASMLAVCELERAFDASSGKSSFAHRAAEACRRGAQNLVDWAVDKGYAEQLRGGADLMGTTLTVAWLEGRRIQVANVGDSRAYLLDGDDVEQLTVDGDLGSFLLAQGYAPESLKQIGLSVYSLHQCIGGCKVNESNEIVPIEDFCKPTLFDMRLAPGDIVVLCSDGLVEEGMFLDAKTLGHLVRGVADRPAQEIAEFLGERADALQRPPTEHEPDGLGDNISVIVVKVLNGAK